MDQLDRLIDRWVASASEGTVTLDVLWETCANLWHIPGLCELIRDTLERVSSVGSGG